MTVPTKRVLSQMNHELIKRLQRMIKQIESGHITCLSTADYNDILEVNTVTVPVKVLTIKMADTL